MVPSGGLRAVVAGAQCAAAEHLWVIGAIGHLIDRGDFDDFEKVEFGGWVLFTLHNQHVFEALVVFGAIECFAVAQTVELEAFRALRPRAWVANEPAR